MSRAKTELGQNIVKLLTDGKPHVTMDFVQRIANDSNIKRQVSKLVEIIYPKELQESQRMVAEGHAKQVADVKHNGNFVRSAYNSTCHKFNHLIHGKDRVCESLLNSAGSHEEARMVVAAVACSHARNVCKKLAHESMDDKGEVEDLKVRNAGKYGKKEGVSDIIMKIEIEQKKEPHKPLMGILTAIAAGALLGTSQHYNEKFGLNIATIHIPHSAAASRSDEPSSTPTKGM